MGTLRCVSIVVRRAACGLACAVTVTVAACSQLTGSGNRASTSLTPTTGRPSAAPSVALPAVPSAVRSLSAATVPMAVVSQGESEAELVPVYVNGHGP